MEKTGKNKWWQGSWTIPLSIMLHVLIGTTYILWSGYTPAPAQPEPESVSVEMVEPPKEEPPPKPEEKKPEEKKAEEPPPPTEEKPQEPPPSQMPPVAIRPGPTQLDERDEPGAQEAGGQEQKTPEKAEETPQPASPPPPEPSETKEEAVASEAEANADRGEIPASPAPVPDDMVSVAVPLPKPEVTPKPHEPATAPPDGESNPDLKPAKKIISAAKRPGPMLRQIMGELPPRDRVAQLCVAEAMAQIKDSRGFYEGLKPHTGRNFPVAGDVMDAQGAFNVGTQWYPINYRCRVDIDNYIVTDFNFAIGPKLSTDDIKRLRLPAR
ncbi:DUF930 domain-containing protein [Agrobacterium rubi]|uniref:DUF930 domain-containing protein n=1 Tax=Agrobacterium rubi TaxID=28099 RepID=UPI001571A25B|nr:DUF930 domain-containing protein [Agrobacterium rubi]NTF08020.1 DUF930 domain-containing protein [Agrobacterium rubi]NTF20248.1 DUF930 domain-containing protein [Agrobacterium rubi]NTF27219.1 DUF930 domain-containing protein [Agrobacterium rubi]